MSEPRRWTGLPLVLSLLLATTACVDRRAVRDAAVVASAESVDSTERAEPMRAIDLVPASSSSAPLRASRDTAAARCDNPEFYGVSANQPQISDTVLSGPLLRSFAATGAGSVRLAISWEAIERQAGSLDWSAIDARFAVAERESLSVLAYVAHTPDWAVREDLRGVGVSARTLPPDPDRWNQFLRAAVQRYAARVDAWEVWNEQSWGAIDSPRQRGACRAGAWCGTAGEYAELLAASYAIIKAQRPDAPVLIGGLVLGGRRDAFLADVVLALDGRRAFDVVSLHHYGSMAELRRKVAIVRGTSIGSGVRVPVWLTETGSGSRPAPNAVAGYRGGPGQARYLDDVFAAAESLGIARVYWFKLFDTPGANPRFASHGLFDEAGVAKEALSHLRDRLEKCAADARRATGSAP